MKRGGSTGAAGHTRKHSGAHKAKHRGGSGSKHAPQHQPGSGAAGGSAGTVHVVAHHPQPAKPRGLSPGRDVACCSAEALGTLLGWGWDQVLDLYWRTTGDPDSGASIEATLRAADVAACDVFGECEPFSAGTFHFRGRSALGPYGGDLDVVPVGHGLILGAELPGAHALAVTPDGRWWSWGEPFDPADFAGAVIEEAWAVTWR